jgi:hypothetical protein
LGLTNPLAIAWELVPFSFVLDWLVPVGTWLQSLDATLGVKFVGGCRTDTFYADCTGTQHPSWFTRTTPRTGQPAKIRNRIFVIRRTPITKWPWAFPYWVNPLTSTHTASAIALLASTRRG